MKRCAAFCLLSQYFLPSWFQHLRYLLMQEASLQQLQKEGQELYNLINSYPEEIELIETTCGVSITEINDIILDNIKNISIEYLNDTRYDFSGFMTDLSILYTEKSLTKNSITPFGRGDELYFDNYKITPIRSYGALKGKYITEVAANSTETLSGTYSLGFSTGEIVAGVSLTTGVSFTRSYSVSGPNGLVKMCNGETPTHNIAVGVFMGAVNKVEYDIVNPVLGFSTHHVTYVIDSATSDVINYTLLANIQASKCVVQDSDADFVVQYQNKEKFKEAFEKTPSIVVW